MKKYILSFDAGTTGITISLFNIKNFSNHFLKNFPFKQIYPKPSWVEHDLNEIWSTLNKGIEEALTTIETNELISIGITNQRETICAFNRSGQPLANAIVWQDKRTTDLCHKMKINKSQDWIQHKTGLSFDPYFSATKVQWLLKNNERIQKAYKDQDLLFGTIDTFILFKLTNGSSFATEASNASRTLLMNIKKNEWDRELLDLFEVDKKLLPEIKDSFGEFGKTNNHPILPSGLPITGILGDQQSALLGQGCTQSGELKCTYGTGAFILANTGKELIFSNSGILTTIAYRHKSENYYALEGSSFIAGASVQWIRDNLKLFKAAADIESMAQKVSNLEQMKNILFLPFFSGIGSPHWIPEATAAIVGITRDTDSSHISRAALEGIALSIFDLIKELERSIELSKEFKVDGGAAKNKLLLEIQATVLGRKISRPKNLETTVLGATLASAIGAEIIDIQEIGKKWELDCSIAPKREWRDYYNNKLEQWNSYIHRLYK